MEGTEGKLPLGLCRQACLKLESFAEDIREIIEDEDVEQIDKDMFSQMADMAGVMMANIVNIVSKEMGEEEFLSEKPNMDEISEWPGSNIDIGEDAIGDEE